MTTLPVNDLSRAAEKAVERFLYGLDQVPDDRLSWRPSDTCKSPLEIVARMSGHVRFVARCVADRSVPDRVGFYANPPTTRSEAHRAISEAVAELVAVFDSLTPSDLEAAMTAPWGETLPVHRYLPLCLNSLFYFQGQLNYVQMAYGDMGVNIPPHWRP